MMDTGIDAPRVLNLVFFKVVRSYAKFWQMIGRGTRLCPDVYGPGQPKESFLIFDVCGNFDFFETKKKGAETKAIKPITQQIFESRVHLSRLLAETGEIEDLELSKDLRDLLHHAVEQLVKEKDRIQVRMKLKYVDEFSSRDRWNTLSNDDVHILEEHLSELPIPESINEMARRFDLLMLKLQIASLMMSGKTKQYQENLIQIAEGLSQKYTIPQVARSKGLIEGMRDPDFYKGISQKKLEEVREEIRELVQYLETQGRETVYTDIKDSDIISTVREPDLNMNYGTIYKKRVEKYIREHKNHLTISKLNTNQAITRDEVSALEEILFDGSERGTREDFHKEYGDEPLGVFIRSIVGLDTKAAQQAFSEFIDAGNLSSAQMVFIQNIIDHLTINGTIDPGMLFEPPFTDLSQDGVYGLFDDGQAQRIVTIIEGINDNALGA
jgi:type I restriction enzyme R subunit